MVWNCRPEMKWNFLLSLTSAQANVVPAMSAESGERSAFASRLVSNNV